MKRFLAILVLFSATALAQTVPPQLISPAGSTAGQAIVSTGPSSYPVWGSATASGLTPITANSVYGNFTGSSASPIANAVPSCSTANSALKYTSGTGLSCGTAFALTSGNLSQFASTTSAQLLGVLSDETGSGLAVFGTSPSLTTPTIAGAALSGTFSGAPTFSGAVTFSSTITPSQTVGIVGTTTNNNANSGAWGEYGSNQNTALNLTNGVAATATSLTLGPGDYTVGGSCVFQPAGSTSINTVNAGLNIGASLPAVPLYTQVNNQSTGLNVSVPVPTQRFLLGSTTTINLNVVGGFTISTMTVVCQMWYRRAR